MTKEEVDAIIVQHFRNDQCEELKHIVSSWQGLTCFECRKDIFREALDAHVSQHFFASTHTIVPHFEGIAADFIWEKTGKDKKNKKTIETVIKHTGALSLPDFITCAPVMRILLGMFDKHDPRNPNHDANTKSLCS